MLKIEQLLTPDDNLVHHGSNHHLNPVYRSTARQYLDACNLAVISTGLVIPNDGTPDLFLSTPLDESADLNLQVGYNPSRELGFHIPTSSEFLAHNQDESRINEITFYLFEFDEKQPWTLDPDAFGRYISPASKYLKDYKPRDHYIKLIAEFIKQRAQQNLFTPIDRFNHLLSVSQ